MNGFVLAAAFNHPHEYAVLKLLLEQRNIAHFFENETAISIFPSIAIGKIWLKVHQNDLEEVEEIIKSLEQKGHLKIV